MSTGRDNNVYLGYTFTREAYDYSLREGKAFFDKVGKEFYPEEEVLFHFARASDSDGDRLITLAEMKKLLEDGRESPSDANSR